MHALRSTNALKLPPIYILNTQLKPSNDRSKINRHGIGLHSQGIFDTPCPPPLAREEVKTELLMHAFRNKKIAPHFRENKTNNPAGCPSTVFKKLVSFLAHLYILLKQILFFVILSSMSEAL
jgi:hypothetical protein